MAIWANRGDIKRAISATVRNRDNVMNFKIWLTVASEKRSKLFAPFASAIRPSQRVVGNYSASLAPQRFQNYRPYTIDRFSKSMLSQSIEIFLTTL